MAFISTSLMWEYSKSSGLEARMRVYVDSFSNGEDIAMNFVAAGTFKAPPILVNNACFQNILHKYIYQHFINKIK
jgi:hypothetical protein